MNERVHIEQANLQITDFTNMQWLENYLNLTPLNLVKDGDKLLVGDPYIDWFDGLPAELHTLFRIGIRGHMIIVFYSGWHTKFILNDDGLKSRHCELIERE